MRRTAQRRRRAAFTLIEVMVSLAIMTVGAMAIIALQQHAIRSNGHARELTTALQIAQMWQERLKQDAQSWNQVAVAGGAPTVATVLANTRYLSSITAGNAFHTIPATTDTVSNAFDRRGDDIRSNDANIFYCASIRLSWVHFGRAMRSDVRVWWARDQRALTQDFSGCSDDLGLIDPAGSQFNNYHVVYLPSVIRMVEVFN